MMRMLAAALLCATALYTDATPANAQEPAKAMETSKGKVLADAKGMTLYFERHDGQAVTCDDFAQAIADANPDSPLARLLPQFKRWYSQAGTPRLTARGQYDAAARSYTLRFTQSCPPTPGQAVKEPFVLPVNLGLVAAAACFAWEFHSTRSRDPQACFKAFLHNHWAGLAILAGIVADYALR